MQFLKLFSSVALSFLTLVSICFFRAKPCFDGGENYTFYVGANSSSCKIVKAEGSPLLCKFSLKEVRGECATYKDKSLQYVLQTFNAKIKFKETFLDGVNYYCTADLPYSITLYGQNINLHVCEKDGVLVVGSPIIFGGY